jgi:16S rRNA (cytidine1402-2'-O)-methyltransferase
MPGTLFVVATPIGNLEDLSFRAARTLKEVDVIAAEDTRRTSKLLAQYEIRKPLVSLREHNETRESRRLIARLSAGESVALVSDAGTPTIADPGARLVRAARDAGIRVVPLPGPSAVMTALSASGLPADQFVFLGFPPRSGRDRTEWFDALRAETRTAVFFEAPHRIERTLTECGTRLVKRQIICFRELSKINEESIEYPTIAPRPQGEFTVVVAGHRSGPTDQADAERRAGIAVSIFGCLTDNTDIDDESAIEMAGRAVELESRAVSKALKKHRYSIKRLGTPSS